jgi:hypothetical protein
VPQTFYFRKQPSPDCCLGAFQSHPSAAITIL